MKLTVQFFFPKSEHMHNQKRRSEIRIDISITEKSGNCSIEKARSNTASDNKTDVVLEVFA